MPLDLEPLQIWYRGALRRRIDELRSLRGGLDRGDSAARAAAREVGRALRGSGGSYGFPRLSETAALLETSAGPDVSLRVEGLVECLWGVVHGETSDAPIHAEWLVRSAGLTVDRSAREGFEDLWIAWAVVVDRTGMAPATLARRVARRFGIRDADRIEPDPVAARRIPVSFMNARLAVPIAEDAERCVVATADPTSLALELEVRRCTGRTPEFRVAPPEAIARALEALPVRGADGPASFEADRSDVGGTVLVVDDDDEVRLFIRRILERRGYDVLEAPDGRVALDVVRRTERPIVAALVDLEMPHMSGREFLGALRASESGAALPVIIVTGHEELLLEVDLIEEGADDYIRKPFDPRLLLARVNATLRRSGDGSGR